jgi:hypothetical protein
MINVLLLMLATTIPVSQDTIEDNFSEVQHDFACSAVARFAGNIELSDKLFNIGYNHSMELIDDLEKVKDSPISAWFKSLAPVNSKEFIVGRMYESAVDRALDAMDVTEASEDEELTNQAKMLFLQNKCFDTKGLSRSRTKD